MANYHFQGGRLDGIGPWTCPSCRTVNQTPFEAGCSACGTGTAAEIERAEAARLAAAHTSGISEAVLLAALVPSEGINTLEDPPDIRLHMLSVRARLSLARALGAYAEQGAPSPEELTRRQCLAWGQLLAATIPEEPT